MYEGCIRATRAGSGLHQDMLLFRRIASGLRRESEVRRFKDEHEQQSSNTKQPTRTQIMMAARS